VIIQFVVEENGEIREIQIVQDSGTESGDEIIGVINTMPNWVPGSFEGHPVRVLFRLPITFEPFN